MENINERPVCHRAEDLVTYLYGEANAAEARDFATHLERCDACRAEFTLFNQVHESIVTWRNEALGTATVPAVSPVAHAVPLSRPFVQHERKLSAWASLREFFSVSPLWLRGATAFAGLLLCALLIFAASRLWQQPTPEIVKTNEPASNQPNFEQAVQKEVEARMAGLNRKRAEDEPKSPVIAKSNAPRSNVQTATRGKSKRSNGLNQQEREQLAADLGLIPGRDEELPFVLPEEPNQ
ncbi:MAG TPA: zf-HC2 domain-containing protein [Pyrinomonadaceae bacterium]